MLGAGRGSNYKRLRDTRGDEQGRAVGSRMPDEQHVVTETLSEFDDN